LKARTVLKTSILVLDKLGQWDEDHLHQAVTETSEKLEVKPGVTYSVLRVALTGAEVTPGGSVEIADILGKAESMSRLYQSDAWLSEK
jgi:glutamyl-tRNA synthetase